MNWFKKTIAAVLALLTIFGTTITTPIIAEDTAGTGTQTTETAVSSVIQGSYEYNGVTVDVNAPEGAFPAGTTLSIVPVVNSSIDQAVAGALEDTKQLNGTVAFNISFFDSNGNELQPAAGYQVDIKFGVSQNSTAVTDSTDAIQVFHMDTAAGAAEAVSSEVAVSGSGKTDIQVEAKSFSIYVVGTSEPKTLTFHFYDVNNQLIAADTQIVKSNEIVSEPAVPETAGLKFTGWFKTGSSTPYVFGSVGTISATATVDLYAKYSSEYHGTEDVTANYAITYTDGTLTVTPAAVELTANSGTKAYDGTALLPSGYTITSGAFVTGQGLSAVEISGSQLFVGSSSSHITGHTLAEGTDAANYTITYKDGQLTVTQAQIALTITADSSSKIYDGTALTDSGYTSTGTLAAHDILSSVAVAGTQTDAGSSANTPSGAVIMTAER